jgi:uncharacterized protein YhaN
VRIRKIGIQSVLNYNEFDFDFGEEESLHILYGPNETGKSTLLQVLLDLLFGGKVEEAFRDHYDTRSGLVGILEHPGQSPLHILRKKRYSKLILTDGSQLEMPEEVLLPYLGGFTKEQFTLLFGFDHDRLRHGGESLLQSGGHVGISLFEAGGGVQDLQALLKVLSDRSSSLLDPNFGARSAKVLNKAWRAYNDAEKEVRSSGLRGEDWDRLRHEVESKDKIVKNLQEQKRKKDLEVLKLQRIQRVRNPLTKLHDVRRQLLELGTVTVLSSELNDRIPEILDRHKGIIKELTSLEDQYRRQVEAMEKIVADPKVIQNESEIDVLSEGLQQYVSRKTEEIPKAMEKQEQKRREALRLLKSLAPDVTLDSSEQLRIPFADEERIQLLSDKLKEERIQANTAQGRYDESLAEKIKIQADLVRMGEPLDVSEFRYIIQGIQSSGDVEENLNKLEQDMEQKRKALQTSLRSQSIWTGAMHELQGLAMPLLETINSFHEAWTNAEKELDETRRDLVKTRENLVKTVQRLEELELGGYVPVEAELLKARQYRDMGWKLVKNVWLQSDLDPEQLRDFTGERSLEVAFEAAVEEADDVADLMRRESDRSAQRAHLLLQKDQFERAIVELEKVQEQNKEALSSLHLRWRQEWLASGIEPKTPVEMKEWLTVYYRPMVENLNTLRALEDEHKKLLQRRDSFVAQLQEALTVLQVNPSLTDAGLKSWLRFCEQLVSEAEEKKRKHLNAVEKLHDCEEKLVEQEQKLRLVKQRLEEIESEWQKMRERYSSLPEDSEVAIRYIGLLRQLFQGIGEVEQFQFEFDAKQKDCQRFEKETKVLADRLGEDLLQYPSIEAWVRHIRECLRVAQEEAARLKQMLMELEQVEEKIRGFRNDAKECRIEIERYMHEHGCDDEDGLRWLVQQSIEYQQLEDRRKQIESQLHEAGDGLSVSQLEVEVAEIEDPDLIFSRMEELKNEIEGLNKQLENEQKRLWELQHEFNELDGSRTDAADQAQKAESHLAEVDRLWNEYLRVELARRLLQREIEQFRQQNESSVLVRASEFFHHLTLGRYKSLIVEYDGTQPYIEAIHRDGSKRRVHQMSDGTRDQLFLAMRFAFVDQHLTQSHPLPLIMDDILVHFDDDRTRATLEILHSFAGKTQILYFTHHRSVVEVAQKLIDASRVRVHDLASYHKKGLKHG